MANMHANNIQQEKENLLHMITKEAYCRKKVVLSSGKESDYYIDARRVTLNPQGAYLCARLILDTIGHEDIDAIGGPTLGADPLLGAIAVLSHQLHRPLNTFIIRKSQKPHGKQQQIEGPLLKEGCRVVLIDDVATTGKALVHSIEVLHQLDVQVRKAICIVDRNEGAKEALAQKGCELVTIFNISDIQKHSRRREGEI
jgi:orotate phosphoribosyltransferase